MVKHVGESTSQTLSNKTLGSDLNAGGYKITNLAAPVNDNDAARKADISGALTKIFSVNNTIVTGTGTFKSITIPANTFREYVVIQADISVASVTSSATSGSGSVTVTGTLNIRLNNTSVGSSTCSHYSAMAGIQVGSGGTGTGLLTVKLTPPTIDLTVNNTIDITLAGSSAGLGNGTVTLTPRNSNLTIWGV